MRLTGDPGLDARSAKLGFLLLSAEISAFFLSTGVLEILTFVKCLLIFLGVILALPERLFTVPAEVCYIRTLA